MICLLTCVFLVGAGPVAARTALPKDPYVTLARIKSRYQAAKSFEADITHHHDSGIYPGEYEQHLHWTSPDRIEIETTKAPRDSSGKPGKMSYDGSGVHVVGGTLNIPDFKLDSGEPYVDICGGPVLQWLLRSKESMLGSSEKVKATWGGIRVWHGQRVRVINLTVKMPPVKQIYGPQTTQVFLNMKADRFVGCERVTQGDAEYMIYSRQVFGKRTPSLHPAAAPSKHF